jgi:hypothetical protein
MAPNGWLAGNSRINRMREKTFSLKAAENSA